MLGLPDRGVGRDRAALPVRVLTELGGLAGRPGCPPAQDAHVLGPAGAICGLTFGGQLSPVGSFEEEEVLSPSVRSRFSSVGPLVISVSPRIGLLLEVPPPPHPARTKD